MEPGETEDDGPSIPAGLLFATLLIWCAGLALQAVIDPAQPAWGAIEVIAFVVIGLMWAVAAAVHIARRS